jgi:ARMC9-like protein
LLRCRTSRSSLDRLDQLPAYARIALLFVILHKMNAPVDVTRLHFDFAATTSTSPYHCTYHHYWYSPIHPTVQVLLTEPGDTVSRQNALGTLQKLSLRRKAQSAMIRSDMIAWLVRVLSESSGLAEYTVEYGCALLMNLCLRTAGKIKCEKEDQLLGVLRDHLNHENSQVRSYIHGALYGVLTRSAIRKRARGSGLADDLEAARDGSSDPTVARQIPYILDQLAVMDEDGPAMESDDEAEGIRTC